MKQTCVPVPDVRMASVDTFLLTLKRNRATQLDKECAEFRCHMLRATVMTAIFCHRDSSVLMPHTQPYVVTCSH